MWAARLSLSPDANYSTKCGEPMSATPPLRKLQYVLTVARELHFRKAAERLHVEQSSISQQIREVEEELGFEIFRRDNHLVALTDAGRAFILAVDDIMTRLDADFKRETRRDSIMNRSWDSSRQVVECEVNSANSQQGRQKRVAVRPDAESAEERIAQLAINLIHGKWKTRILSRLQHGPVRLSELRRMFPEASKKMLTQHLREMERDGLVVRNDLSGRLRHVEYFLSDSMGFAVLHLISTLTKWGREYLPYEANASE